MNDPVSLPVRAERSSGRKRMRVLFVSEAVTLAQIVRLVVLGRSLDPELYEVHFASAIFPSLIFRETGFAKHRLYTVPPERVHAAVASGRRIYDRETLERYVRADQEVIARVKPELIVGDLRWSLSVSAPLSGVPYAGLANAYWSQQAQIGPMPLPEHPIVKLLGPRWAAGGFSIAFPHVSRHFARPLDELRRVHGLAPLGSLQDIVTHGDYTLFSDTPGLVPTKDLPPTQHYLGPVLWSPPGSVPDDWGTTPSKPPVYVTLGSSGDLRVLPTLLSSLSELGVDVLLATAGRTTPRDVPANVRVADYVPGDVAARRARIVITNGGSTSGYQALFQGSPVVGIPFNLDQYLAMSAITQTGAGVCLRSGTLDVTGVRAAVRRCLDDESIRDAALRAQTEMHLYDPRERFKAFVREYLAAGRPRAGGATQGLPPDRGATVSR